MLWSTLRNRASIILGFWNERRILKAIIIFAEAVNWNKKAHWSKIVIIKVEQQMKLYTDGLKLQL
jgi:hypothetical protein